MWIWQPLAERLRAAVAELDRLRHDLALATAHAADRGVHHVEATVEGEAVAARDEYLRAYA